MSITIRDGVFWVSFHDLRQPGKRMLVKIGVQVSHVEFF